MKGQKLPRMIRPTRRELLRGLAGATAGWTLAGATRIADAQARPPIKIGILCTYTGALASLGQTILDGINLYFDQIDWQIAGRRVELINEDDQMSPQVALQKARKLLESDHVQAIFGPLASNVAMAMVNYLGQAQGFWLVTGAGASQMTRLHMPYMFRCTLSTWQVAHPTAEWVYDNIAKEAILTASDYVAGHDILAEFKEPFIARGGKVLKEIYPPLGTTDFSAYLTDIRSIAPPMTYSFYGGTDSVRFVTQYAQLGMKERIKLVGFGSLCDNDTIPSQGRAALGAITSSIYCDTLDNKENIAFVAAFRKKYNDFPSVFSESGYTTARVFAEAARAVQGKVEDKDKLSAAMVAVNFAAPRGPFRFDPATHHPIQNVYLRQVVERDGRIANQPIATIPEVRDPGIKSG